MSRHLFSTSFRTIALFVVVVTITTASSTFLCCPLICSEAEPQDARFGRRPVPEQPLFERSGERHVCVRRHGLSAFSALRVEEIRLRGSGLHGQGGLFQLPVSPRLRGSRLAEDCLAHVLATDPDVCHLHLGHHGRSVLLCDSDGYGGKDGYSSQHCRRYLPVLR